MNPAPWLPLETVLGRRAPDLPLCRDGGALRAWGEFQARAGGIFHALSSHAGNRWVLTARAPFDFAAALLAGLHAGKTLLLPANRLSGSLADTLPDADGLLDDGETEIPGNPVRLHLGEIAPRAIATWPAIDPERPSLVLMTSGSTGEAKRVPKRLRQLNAELEALEALWGPRLGNSECFATVSHQHIYGLLFRVLWPLAAGRVFQGATHAYPEQLASDLATSPCDRAHLVASPTQLQRMPDLLNLARLHDRCPVVFSSGGPLPPDVAARFAREGGEPPLEILGSTETGGVAWRRQDAANPDALWTPFAGVEVRADDSGAALRVRSQKLEDPVAWHVMDDLARAGPGGTFALLGRADRIVKVGEKRVSLEEVEARLRLHPWVAACAVQVVEEKPGRRQVLGAVVEPTAEGCRQLAQLGRRATNAALRASLAGHLEPVALPRKWRYAGTLPVNAQGKRLHGEIERLLLREPHQDGNRLPEVHPREESPHRRVLALYVNPDLPFFPGHFPGAPVTPGVVLVDWAARLASPHPAGTGTPHAWEAVKFLKPVPPGARLELTLDWDPARRRLAFAYTDHGAPCASGRVLYPPEVAP